jgi:hypothetical protein
VDHYIGILNAEDLLNTDKFRTGLTAQATISGTLSLTRVSTCQQVFTGTTAGQIVKLPDATTLIYGFTYLIWNESTKSITIQNDGGTSLLIIPSQFNCIVSLRDATTTNGLWLLSRSTPGGGGSGVTPPFIFSKSGGAGVNSYLKTGEVLTSKTGQLIKGSNYIVELNCSNSATVGGTLGAIIKMQRRTGLSTFVDIPSATVTVPSGSYSGQSTGMLVSLGLDWELSCYNSGPENLIDPVVTMFLIPQ